MNFATPIHAELPLLSNPLQTQAAYLVWQSPAKHAQGKGPRHRVGMLRADPSSDNVVFNYLPETEDFNKAKAKGFNGYTGIPLGHKGKDTTAFFLLQKRVPDQKRSDSNEYLAQFGLCVKHNLTPLSVLAYTGARQIGSSFSIVETFEGFDTPFQYIFDLAGRRYCEKETPNIKTGDDVSFVPEPNNESDPFAVCLKDANGQRLGYINRCQAKKVQSWVHADGITNPRVYRVNGRRDYPRLFVMCDINPQ